jgi:hypothetical protein
MENFNDDFFASDSQPMRVIVFSRDLYYPVARNLGTRACERFKTNVIGCNRSEGAVKSESKVRIMTMQGARSTHLDENLAAWQRSPVTKAIRWKWLTLGIAMIEYEP